MKPTLIYDTETTGLPVWGEPSGDGVQPHLVQLAALLVDADTMEILETMDVIVFPDGWEIPDEVAEVHGITTEIAKEKGIPERDALEQFLALWNGCNRVAFNRTFDQRIIRIALKRYSDEDTIDRWADKDSHECAMLMAKPIMKLPPKGRYGFKNPRLEQAYEHFTGKKLENAHNALADTAACMEVYFAIKNAEVAA